jgi:hypothetical protein
VFLFACHSPTFSPTTVYQPHKILVQDSAVVHVGDTIEVKILNTGADGGFWWDILFPFDSTIIVLDTFTTQYTGTMDSAGHMIIGAPIYEIWDFIAIDTGRTSCTFASTRFSSPGLHVISQMRTLIVKE